jgi:hypothetical protein
MGCDQLKCYNVTSHTLLYLIFVIRIFTELTAINYDSAITDPAFKYLIIVKNETTIGPAFLRSGDMHFVIAVVFFLQLLYFFCLLTLGFN